MSTLSNLNLNLIRSTIKLLQNYDNVTCQTPIEFLKAQEETVPENVVKFFMLLIKHNKLLDDLNRKIVIEYDLKKVNVWAMKVFLSLLIFLLNRKNIENIQNIFKSFNNSCAFKIVDFFLDEENLIYVARVGCMYFDYEYVLENVVRPLVNKMELIKNFRENVFEHYTKKNSVLPKEVTKPIENKLFVKKKSVDVKIEEVPKAKIVAKAIPKTTYSRSLTTLTKINECKDKNWENALKLYEEAKNCPVKVAHYTPKPIKSEPVLISKIPQKHVPKFPDVKIKSTTTSLLREAAYLSKEKEQECKKLNDLLIGGFDIDFEAMKEDIRKEDERKHLENIERKHLEGLLTFEEALLAKKKVVQINQEKMEKFKEERLGLIQKLLAWRSEEEEKIKQLVEKSQNIEKAAKEAEKKVLNEKQAIVRLMDYESRKMKEDLQKKREEELQKKINLIQDIRTLHQIRTEEIKEEFDATECPNLGLLCEMSLAELQERLKLLKIQMKEDLEEKKAAVLDVKKKKAEFIDNVKEFIEQSRSLKPISRTKIVPKNQSPADVLNTPELCALREKLHQVREMRKRNIT